MVQFKRSVITTLIVLTLILSLAPLPPLAEAVYVPPYSDDDPIEDAYLTAVARDDAFDRWLIYETNNVRSYSEWNISSIPVGSNITDVKIIVDIAAHDGGTNLIDFHIMEARPSTAAIADAHADAGDGTIFISYNATVGTQTEINLGPDAAADLEANLTNGWWAVGVNLNGDPGEEVQIWSEDKVGADPHPTLVVTYIPPGNESYTLIGAFYENGTRAPAVTVTAHETDASSSEITVNGTVGAAFTSEVVMFTWPLSGGGFRQFYVNNSGETFYFFVPSTSYAVYTFFVKDYVGYLGAGDLFLEALRVVNGSEFLIQRNLIQDSVTGAAMTLEQYQIYILQIRAGDDVYRFGYYTTEYDPEITLRLRGLEFSERAEASYKYATIEGTRPNSTHLRGNYQDSRNATTSVFFEILWRNYTQVYNDSWAGDSVQFNYYGADNETDYVIHMVAVHEEFGTIEEYFPLVGISSSPNAVPTLEGFPIPYVLGNILLLACFGLVSETTAPEGAFLVWIVAAMLNATGFISIPSETFIYVIALIALMKMRGSGGGPSG